MNALTFDGAESVLGALHLFSVADIALDEKRNS